MTTAEAPEPAPTVARRGPGRLATAILAGMLALAVGFAIGVLIAKPAHPADDSAEAGFARDMSTHHSQAVEMGMVAWQRGTMPETRTLGYDIALTQQAQIGIMRGWLDKWGLSPSSRQPAMAWMEHGEHLLGPDGRMPGMASPEQLDKLRGAQAEQVDILFCNLMIDHHLAGVDMAKEIVERTDDEEVRQLAQGMIDAQEYEIQALRSLSGKLDA